MVACYCIVNGMDALLIVINNLLTSTKHCSGWMRQNRILGSVHWIADPALDPDSSLFVSGSKMPTKNTFFCLLLSVGTFAWAFTDNKILRSQKTVEIKVFLKFFAWRWKDLNPDPGSPKTYGFRSGTLVKNVWISVLLVPYSAYLSWI